MNPTTLSAPTCKCVHKCHFMMNFHPTRLYGYCHSPSSFGMEGGIIQYDVLSSSLYKE
jgi:hypothetical protein